MSDVTAAEFEQKPREILARVEAGESIAVLRDDRVIARIEPSPSMPRRKDLDWEAGRRFLEAHGIKEPFPYVAPDFDDPLPEDFLIRPMP